MLPANPNLAAAAAVPLTMIIGCHSISFRSSFDLFPLSLSKPLQMGSPPPLTPLDSAGESDINRWKIRARLRSHFPFFRLIPFFLDTPDGRRLAQPSFSSLISLEVKKQESIVIDFYHFSEKVFFI